MSVSQKFGNFFQESLGEIREIGLFPVLSCCRLSLSETTALVSLDCRLNWGRETSRESGGRGEIGSGSVCAGSGESSFLFTLSQPIEQLGEIKGN